MHTLLADDASRRLLLARLRNPEMCLSIETTSSSPLAWTSSQVFELVDNSESEEMRISLLGGSSWVSKPLSKVVRNVIREVEPPGSVQVRALGNHETRNPGELRFDLFLRPPTAAVVS